MARNGQKQELEVRSCAIPNSILPSLTKTFKKRKMSAAGVMPLMFKCSGQRSLYYFIKIRRFKAHKLRPNWVCTSKPSASGENGGQYRGSHWKTFLGRDGRGVFPPEDRAQVISFACDLPARYDLPFSHFSLMDLLDHIGAHTSLRLSLSTLWRWLNEHAIRPWQSRTWLFPRDPKFLAKATPVLDLYQGRWQGEPLAVDDFVISADEKPGIQALERRHKPTAPQPGKCTRIEHEYRRHGTAAYLAAIDVQSGRVMGRMDDRTGIEPFMQLVDDVMRRKSYRKARRVFWIVDNGSSHHPSTFGHRLKERYPNAIPVHLPTHASWLNQIEIYFAILQRKLLKRGHFTSIKALKGRVLDFQHHYNRNCRPFNWRFTVQDLKKRLAAISL